MSNRDKRIMDGTKMLWHMDRVLDWERGERIAPIHIDMGISKFCNVKCVFCYGIYQNPKYTIIQRRPLLQTMKDAGAIGIKSLAIIGDGEPTCNPYFYEALYVGKESGLSLACSTNGILLSQPERRKAILDNCEWMRFCLAAGDREGYKKIHRADKFDIVKKNIEALLNERDQLGSKTDIGLQAVYVPNLMDEDMIKESRLAVKLGIDYFVIKQCSLPEENKKVGDIGFDVNLYDSEKIINTLKECENYSTDKTKIIVKWNVIAQKGIRDYHGCPSIPLISEMSGNGDWYPCGFMFGNKKEFDEYKFGNVHEKSLKEIFESDRYWNIVKKMRDYNVQRDCTGCCRQDQINRFLDDYLDKPQGVNFP